MTIEKKNTKRYMDSVTKAYYLGQLELCRHLPPSSDRDVESWRMDNRLETDLVRINQFDCLQTILSRFPRTATDARNAPAYLNVAYTEAAEGPVMVALKAAKDKCAKSLDMYWTRAEGETIDWGDALPPELRHLDAIVDPSKYLEFENVLVLFDPRNSVIERGGDAILDAMNEGWEAIIDALELVGIELEGAK